MQNPTVFQINVKNYSYIYNFSKKRSFTVIPILLADSFLLLFMLINPNPKAASFLILTLWVK